MFPIKGIRKYVTDKLDEITVLRKFRESSGVLKITETADKNDEDRKPIQDRELLDEVKVIKIPLKNVWVFENEFGQQRLNINNIEEDREKLLNTQKGAFTSAGKKVEKTIIYYDSNRLYLFMIEMKRTISPRKMQEDVVKKFENTLSTLSVFISAHFDFPQFEDAQIYPVGICCYNYYDDPQPSYNRDPKRIAGRVRKKYSEGKRLIKLFVEPIGLNRMKAVLQFVDKYLITRFGSCFNQAGCYKTNCNRAVLSTSVNFRGTPGIYNYYNENLT
jgi:hypothetical protein